VLGVVFSQSRGDHNDRAVLKPRHPNTPLILVFGGYLFSMD
jgi:hypothetical protein